MTHAHKKAIINVRFESNLSEEKLREACYSFSDSMVGIEGLISKYYYSNLDTNIIGGTYIFENISTARKYLRVFLIKGIGVRYGIIPETLKIETGIVHIEMIP